MLNAMLKNLIYPSGGGGERKRETLNKIEYIGKLQKGCANSKLGPWNSKGKIRIKEEIKCVLLLL